MHFLTQKPFSGRGRLIPQLPFDAIWNSVSQWLGVHDEVELEKILPNRKSFPGMLLNTEDLFGEKIIEQQQCDNEGQRVSCIANEKETDDYYYDDDNTFIESQGAPVGTIVSAVLTSIILIIGGVIYAYFFRRGLCPTNPFKDKDLGKQGTPDPTFDMSDEEEIGNGDVKHDDGVIEKGFETSCDVSIDDAKVKLEDKKSRTGFWFNLVDNVSKTDLFQSSR
jgi:hypothetical protein